MRSKRSPLAESQLLDLSKLAQPHVNKVSNSVPQTTWTSLTELHVNKTRNKDFIQVFYHKLKQRVQTLARKNRVRVCLIKSLVNEKSQQYERDNSNDKKRTGKGTKEKDNNMREKSI